MKPVHPALLPFLFLLAAPSSFAAQGQKIPRALVPMPDVKTPASAPASVVGTDPTRVLPEGLERPAPRPAKTAVADDAATGATHPGFGPDFSVVRFDEPGDGALWVRGRTYKARFDGDSATYIPFLGSRAPQNYPLRVELSGVQIDGEAIALRQNALQREGLSVTLDHGLVREVWHMGLESAEQTFVFGARPTGDVELRLAFETELSARETAHGLELDGPHGGVRISGAVAIDAAGRRQDLATRLDAGAIEIDLPSAFSATAVYPLVIDPVYSTYALETSSNASGGPDIANSGTMGTWCATYQYTFSAGDNDVWAQDVYYGQPVAGTGMWVDYTSELWYEPRIAYNALHDTYVVVGWVSGATSKIMARAHYAGTTNQLPLVLVQGASNGSCYSPDIGGDPTLAAPTYFFVTWTRAYSPTDFDIHGRLLDWNGTPLGTGPVLIENSTAYDTNARISKTDGHAPYATQRWNVVWTRGPTSGDIYGAQIDWDGTIATYPFAIDTTSAHDLVPSASSLLDGASGPRPWMVTFTRTHADLDIEARVLVGGVVQGGFNLSVNEYGAIFQDQNWPDVDTNGQRFVVTYSETYNGTNSERDQYVTTVHWNGASLTVDEAHVNVDYSTNDSVQGQISGGMTNNSQGYPYYGLAWPRYGASMGDVWVGAYYESALVESTCFGDGVANACPCGNNGGPGRGCANSATIGAYLYEQGNPWTSADTVSLTAYSLPSSATCLFFQGTGIGASGTTFGDGVRCISGTVVRIGTKTAVNGVAVYPEAGDASISVKGLLNTNGGWRGYQAWYRNAANFCTPSTFNMTSGVRIIWVR